MYFQNHSQKLCQDVEKAMVIDFIKLYVGKGDFPADLVEIIYACIPVLTVHLYC